MKKLLALALAAAMLSTVAFALNDVTFENGGSVTYHHSIAPVDSVTVDSVDGVSEGLDSYIAYKSNSAEDSVVDWNKSDDKDDNNGEDADNGDDTDNDADNVTPGDTASPTALAYFVTIRTPDANAFIGPVLAK